MILYKGQAVPILSIQPNWSSGITVSESYGAIVRETLDHSEERIGTKPRPDYSIRFETMTLSARETGVLRKILELSESLPIAVPFWEDACILTRAAPAGNPFVECTPPDGALFDVLPYVMVWNSFLKFHTAKAAGVGSHMVWFNEILVDDYDVGDRIVPVSIGSLRKDNASALTDEITSFSVNFTEGSFPEPVQFCEDIEGTQQYAQLPFIELCVGGPIL